MIVVEKLSVRAGAFALEGVSFSIPGGAWCVLMGRTGTGKTTLLEIICGLRRAHSGRVRIGERDVTTLRPADRGIGYVPQDKALFATMNVRENLAFALRVRRAAAREITTRVNELAELLNITRLLDRFPHKLSGGEAQRVALGRALAARPSVLCLDEPLSALDDETRDEMREVLRSVHERTSVTTLHITHHLDDARQLANKLFILRDGRVTETALDLLPHSSAPRG